MSSFLGGGGGGGGGGMAIGSNVAGGTSKSVLFVDGSGNLAQANVDFNYDDATKIFDVGSSTTAGTLQVGVPTAAGNPAGTFGILGPKTSGLSLGSYTLEFPGFKGNVGNVLQSNGDGTTGWTIVSGPSGGVTGNVQASDGSGGLTADPGFSVDTTNHIAYIGVAGGGGGGLILADGRYVIDTPSSGGTVDMTGYNPIYTEIIDPAGTLATLTIKLPNLAFDGQILRIKFSQIITALTINPNTGDSVKGNPTSAALGAMIECMFTGTAGSGTWYC